MTFMAALDGGLNEVYVSPQIEAMLGFTQEEWLADPILWYSRLHPDDRAVWNEEFARGCQTGGPFQAECRFLARDGKVVWVHGEARIVKDELGRPLFLQGIALDITQSKIAHETAQARLQELIEERTAALTTANRELLREIEERREAEQALRASEERARHTSKLEAVGRLAGGIAHDFNNLLMVVLSYSEELAEEVGSSHHLYNDLREIESAGRRAATLTQQLLAFSRHQVLQPKSVALNELVFGIEKMLVRLIGADITLVTVLDPTLLDANLDPSQIENVIVNLVLNARDAMPQGGRITISTSNVELGAGGQVPEVELGVTDEGTGMDSATLEHIYEPFFTTKGQGKGTGLGLATVLGIVQQSGGQIEVDSEVGRGTRFRIRFPGLPRVKAAEEARSSGTVSARGTETILVAEDEDGVRNVLVRILRRHGYTVLSAANGRDALDVWEAAKEPIHLLLTDVVMPVMHGVELAKRVIATNPDARIILMSGYAKDVFESAAGQASASFSISSKKPIKPTDLIERVREALTVRGLNHEGREEDV